MRISRFLVPIAAVLVAVGACSGDSNSATPSPSTATGTANPAAVGPADAYHPTITPGDFSTTIDNPFLPFVPGTRLIYEGDTADGHERTVTEVTRDTKVIMGVTCVVVHDVVTVDGVLAEDTFDWYAQDRAGNVWYFGEDTKAFDGAKVDTEGSWEAGVDGAQPGVVMPAHPRVGDAYRQEFLAGVAEDQAEVLSTTETAEVKLGSYDGVVQTEDFSELEPDLVEHKYYARGVGLVLEEQATGPAEPIELMAVEHF